MATKKATKKKTAKQKPVSKMADLQRPSATEAAARKLLIEIDALAKTQQDAISNLKRAEEEAEPVELGQALVDLTRNDEQLRIKTEQLRSLTESIPDGDLRTECLLFLSERDQEAAISPIPALKRRIEIRVTDALVGRTRARRGAAGGPIEGAPPPRRDPPTPEPGSDLYAPHPIEHHDVLVIAPKKVHSPEQFYRFPVVKTPLPEAPDGPELQGQYRDKPELLDAFDYGQRRALSVARPQDWGPASVRATQRGPAFSTLPLKPEPNSAAGGTGESSQCYLINTQNLNFRNAWTAEEWNDTPGGIDLPPAPSANHNEVEALLAGPQGKVFRLVLTSLASWVPGTQARIVTTLPNGAGGIQRELGTVESVHLRPHMEVWHQLRGGTAMGRVYFNDANGPRVVPLVNITTLTRE
jgi:hypothetical protein